MSTNEIGYIGKIPDDSFPSLFLENGINIEVHRVLETLFIALIQRRYDLVLFDREFFSSERCDRLNNFLSKEGLAENIRFVEVVDGNNFIPSRGVVSQSDPSSLLQIIEDSSGQRDLGNDSLAVPEKSALDFNDIFYSSFRAIKDSETVDIVLKNLSSGLEKCFPDHCGLILRFFQSRASLVVSHGMGVDNFDRLSGAGIDFSESIQFDPDFHLPRLKEVPAFKRLVSRIADTSSMELFVLNSYESPFALVILRLAPVDKHFTDIKKLLDLAEERVRYLTLKNRFQTLDKRESETGAFRKDHFMHLVENEFIRARRILLPVSILVVRVDQAERLRKANPRLIYSKLEKAIFDLLNKNTRHNDAIGYLKRGHFAILYPHMSRGDAGKKSSHLIKLFGQFKFSGLSEHLSLSCIHGTYPNCSRSGEELIASLESDLDLAEETPYLNKLEPPPGFEQDFILRVD